MAGLIKTPCVVVGGVIMFSEYLLSDWEADDRKCSRGNGGGSGSGCLVMVAVLGSLLTGGFFGLAFIVICIAL